MPENTGTKARSYEYTQNRELSWLQFNERVLDEADNESVPLLERFHFLSIFASNLDEFFMVRVGSLYDAMSTNGKDLYADSMGGEQAQDSDVHHKGISVPEKVDDKSGWSVKEQLRHIYDAVAVLNRKKDQVYEKLMEQLKECQIEEKELGKLTKEEQKFVTQYYKTQVLPFLSPQVVDIEYPFSGLEIPFGHPCMPKNQGEILEIPFGHPCMPKNQGETLVNKKLYLAVRLHDKKGKISLGFVPVPDSVPRLLVFPGKTFRYIRVETLIFIWAAMLFKNYKTEERCILAVTRNVNFNYEEHRFQGEDFRNQISKLIKKRTQLSIIRLELEGKISSEFLSILEKSIGIKHRQSFFSSTPLDLSYVYNIRNLMPPKQVKELVFAPYQPRWAEDLKKGESMMAQIQKKDRMLFFPYDSIEPFLMLLAEAAEDKRVISIKITVYRLALASQIARTLCRAAENGKQVTVLVELRARFDEENNILWSKILEEAGCQVIYGVEYFKCHSKILSIVYRENGALHYITQIGTGNYNEKTSRLYTDLSYMTASKEIGEDAFHFFENMMDGNLEGKYNRLSVSPDGLKKQLITCIETEIQKGPDGYICMKANSLTDRKIIDKLVEASCAGVSVQLILRGICCLRPGIAGVTENIRVTSIVGRYLEHARIYCFGRGNMAKIFISSADLMTRNLQKRIEIACPVTNPYKCQQLLWILNLQLMDNVKGRFRLSDGSYCQKENSGKRIDSQELFMFQSIHKKEDPPGKLSFTTKIKSILEKKATHPERGF